MCELKLNPKYKDISTTDGHTLTGVWVEISLANDIEIKKSGHTLTGVWVEILHDCKFTEIVGVTHSQVCELKYT